MDYRGNNRGFCGNANTARNCHLRFVMCEEAGNETRFENENSSLSRLDPDIWKFAFAHYYQLLEVALA